MASYINRKSRAFREAGDVELLPKRSEGRMKTYPSATDARAWTDDVEERRNYILELIRKDISKGQGLGKYVPIEVLIDTLLANKNADIERLRQQLEELQKLLDKYEKLDLTEDQKRQLAGTKRSMGKAGAGLESLASPRGGASASEVAARSGMAEGGKPSTDEGKPSSVGEKPSSVGAKSSSIGEKPSSIGEKPSSIGAKSSSIGEKPSSIGAKSSSIGGKASSMGEKPSSAGAERMVDIPAGGGDKDAEIAALRKALADKHEEYLQQRKLAIAAIEQLENLKGIVEERDELRKQLEHSQHELETLKKTGGKAGPDEIAELDAIENELENLRASGKLSSDKEIELMKKELDALKRCCEKMAGLQAENAKLKRERTGKVTDDDMANIDGNLDDLKRKVAKLNETIEERDKLRARCQQLENELLQYGDLPQEIEVFRERSKILDNVIEERDSLHKRLKELEGLEDEVMELKKRADLADRLQKELDALRGKLDTETRSRRASEEAVRSLGDIGNERDMLLRQLEAMQQEMERLKYRANEADALRMERDRLKARVDELAAMETEYMELLNKLRMFETIKAERDMYKSKYEELLGLECECDILRAQLANARQTDAERDALMRQVRECECCIADQEDEIRRLICHIDRLTLGNDEQQGRMKEALTCMREELEKKNMLIAESEDQLTHVQDQLKNTINNVACETGCLRARTQQLEEELIEARRQLDEAREALKKQGDQDMSEQEDLINKMRKELEDARAENEKLQDIAKQMGGDEHAQVLLKESKTAIQKVRDELEKQDEQEKQDLSARCAEEREENERLRVEIEALEERIQQLEKQLSDANRLIDELRKGMSEADQMEAENKALRRHSTEAQEVAKQQIEELLDHLQKAKERIAELEAENEALRRSAQDTMKDLQQLDKSLAEGMEDSESLEKLKKELEEVQREKQRLQDLVKKLQEEAGSSDEEQLAALRSDIAALESQLEKEIKLRQAAEEKIKELEEKLAAASSAGDTAELDKLRKELEDAKRQSEQLKNENDDLKKQLEELRKELEDVKKKNEELKAASSDASKIDALQKEKDDLLKQIENQNKEISDLVSNMKTKTSAEDTTLAQLEKEMREKQELQDLINKLEKQVKDLTQEDTGKIDVASSAVDDAIKKLTSQLEAEEKRANDAEKRAKEAEEALKKLQEELDRLKAQGGELKGVQVDDADGALKSLQDALDKESKESAAYLKEIAELKQKIKDLENENKKLRDQLGSAVSEVERGRRASAEMEAAKNDQIKRMSAEYDDKLKAMEDSMSLSAEEKEKFQKMKDAYEDQIKKLKAQLAKQKKECDETIAALKAQYDRDIKNVHNMHNESISKMQGSHEDVVRDISKEFEKDIDVLRKELLKCKEEGSKLQKENEDLKKQLAKLKQKRPSITSGTRTLSKDLSSKTVETVDIKPKLDEKKEGTEDQCTCGAYLQSVLNKILKGGFEVLSFEELQYLHTQTCDATANLVSRRGGRRPCSAVSQRDMDRMNLLRKINALEDDLRRKQKQTQQKVAALQIAVRIEKQRLEELRKILEVERQRNAELLNKIGMQSKTVASMQIERDLMRRQTSHHEEKMQHFVSKIEEEKSRVQALEETLERERDNVRQLKNMLDSERCRNKQLKKRESEELEAMRLKLEQALNSEMVLKMQLEQKMKPTSQRNQSPCCGCQRDYTQERALVPASQVPQSQTFYTELTVQRPHKKSSFIHHCSMRQTERMSPGSRRRKSSNNSESPCNRQFSPPTTPDIDE